VATVRLFYNTYSRKRKWKILVENIKQAEEELRKEQGDTADLKPVPWLPPKDSGYILLYESEDMNEEKTSTTPSEELQSG
jgi:hypothetical protein